MKTFIAFGFVLILRMCFFSGVHREWKIYFYVYRKSTQAITKTFDLKVDISKCNRIFRLVEIKFQISVGSWARPANAAN